MDRSATQASLSPLHRAIFLLCMFIPPVYLIISNQGFTGLLRGDAPDGQLYYVISRLVGLYAFVFLCWQAISTLLEKTGKIQVGPSHIRRHILMGSGIVVLIFIHSGLFITAVSARAGHLSLQPLVPDFTSGYYNLAVSLGVLALLFTLLAVTAGLLRNRFKAKWKVGHMLIFIVLGLVFMHAWMIGTDVQSVLLAPVFLLAASCLVLLTLWRFISRQSS